MTASPICLVSTRLLCSSSKLRLTSKQMELQEHDFVCITYIDAEEVVQNMRSIFDKDTLLVCTSMHGIRGVLPFLLIQNSCRLTCIAGATLSLAKEHNLNVAYSAWSGKDLGEVILRAKEKKVIHASSSLRRKELEQMLRNASVDFHYCEVYKKKVSHKALNPFDALLVFSPSQIDVFLMCNVLEKHIPVFCIGKTTANHMHSIQKDQPVIIAEKATEQSVLDALCAYFP